MSRMRFTIIFFLSLLAFTSLSAQKVVLEGIATEYAGEDLQVYTINNFITYNESEVAIIEVDEEGNFETSFIVDDITQIVIYQGVYRTYLFVEPGKSYKVIFPERKDKTKAQFLNPFFEEENLHLGILNTDSTELNYQIAVFDEEYNTQVLDLLSNSGSIKNNEKVAKAIGVLDDFFQKSHNQYFKRYKEYKLVFLKLLVNELKVKKVTSLQFVNKPVLYNNPAFMELFNQVFKNYFIYHSRTEEGKILGEAIQNRDIDLLKKALNQNELLANDTIAELVILKSLYDEFYSDNFSRSAMLSVLDKLYFQSKIPEHQFIAQDIREEVTHLLQGFFPPKFELKNKENKLVKLEDFKGKYVYINFAHTQSYTCIKDFESLKKLTEKYNENLEIVSICVDDDERDLWYFTDMNNYNWTFLHYANKPKIIKEFDIRAFPTYFLVGKDGKLLRSPALGPDGGFEQDFVNILLNERGL